MPNKVASLGISAGWIFYNFGSCNLRVVRKLRLCHQTNSEDALAFYFSSNRKSMANNLERL